MGAGPDGMTLDYTYSWSTNQLLPGTGVPSDGQENRRLQSLDNLGSEAERITSDPPEPITTEEDLEATEGNPGSRGSPPPSLDALRRAFARYTLPPPREDMVNTALPRPPFLLPAHPELPGRSTPPRPETRRRSAAAPLPMLRGPLRGCAPLPVRQEPPETRIRVLGCFYARMATLSDAQVLHVVPMLTALMSTIGSYPR